MGRSKKKMEQEKEKNYQWEQSIRRRWEETTISATRYKANARTSTSRRTTPTRL
ncbi:MAG: hypothetical protein J6X55_03990 [Victivallales bacterium]|nr:hypothetical protein [Victivallales bacterium]